MQTALHTLIQSATVCQPIAADLRKSTLTLAWPADRLLQRSDYVLLPKAEVEAALATDAQGIAFPAPSGEGRVRHTSNDCDFVYRRGCIACAIYFTRFKDPEYSHQKPNTWWGSMEMQDASGERWSRSLPRMVMNDFGDLVDLETGERP